MDTRKKTRQRDERGSTTLFFVVIGMAMFLVVGLVVDGGGKIRALQKAESVAEGAARAGGQAIQTGTAVQGDGTILDAAAARQAAQQYLSAAGVDGSVQIVNGTRLVVRTTTHYKPVFLGMAGVGSMTTEGEAEVRLVRGLNGQEMTP